MVQENKDTKVVDLGEYTSSGNRYFTSRSRGIDISRRLELGQLAYNHKQGIVLSFPADLSGINTLFLEELLESAVLSLNPGLRFKDVFSIDNQSLYNVQALVDKAVQSLEQRKEELQISY
jgi:hypothetical protein